MMETETPEDRLINEMNDLVSTLSAMDKHTFLITEKACSLIEDWMYQKEQLSNQQLEEIILGAQQIDKQLKRIEILYLDSIFATKNVMSNARRVLAERAENAEKGA